MTKWTNRSRAQRAKMAEQADRWARDNPAKRRKINQRYRERNRDKERARVKEWRERRKKEQTDV